MIFIFRSKSNVGLTKNHPYIIYALGMNPHSSISQLNCTNEKIPSDYWENLQIQTQEDQSISVWGISKSSQALRAH